MPDLRTTHTRKARTAPMARTLYPGRIFNCAFFLT